MHVFTRWDELTFLAQRVKNAKKADYWLSLRDMNNSLFTHFFHSGTLLLKECRSHEKKHWDMDRPYGSRSGFN